jgi:dihydrofolate reductase
MPRVTADLALSLDGFAAGPHQSLDKPFGEGIDDRLHRWRFEEPERNAEALSAMDEPSVYIMGRNMFGPGRGEWDLDWKGWWGDDPPYHGPVFVLTHHPREPLEMEGGTTFSFVTEGIEKAMELAQAAAGDSAMVSVAGGADTVRQYLSAGLIDELRLHVVPEVVGAGERLWDGLTDLKLEAVKVSGNELVTHVTYRVLR